MSLKKPFERISKNVIPINYSLNFKPDLQKYIFQGSEEISVKIKKATTHITLNSLDIDVSTVQYSSADQTFKDDIKTSYSIEDETATFTFPEKLKSGEGTLSLKFTGQLNDKLKGFYRCKYTHPSGEERFAAVTQFEPTFARRAFPCMDDPVLKATFDISLDVPVDRVTLSNMPVLSQTPNQDDPTLQRVTFAQTPIMPTYLLAMVVGEYDWVEGKDVDGVVVRVYTPLGKKEQGMFALNVTTKTLPFYKEYFNVAYPLPKMDLIALSDFALGGMENWGLITYRETVLLVDEASSSTATKQRVALVVGHEIAHMWFGNLVTMEWWSGLWLKEGFASWIGYLCLDHCFPEFDIWTQFAAMDYSDALNLDALKNSHPIEIDVGNPSEIAEIFDAISYDKGASVIRMLHDYIGDDNFRQGMFLYLNKHQYSTSNTADLWNSLEEASTKDIAKVMSTWTKQTGYPFITVSDGMEGSRRMLKLKQQRFIADGSKDESNPQWIVPISIKIYSPSSPSSPPSSSSVIKFLLEKEEDTVYLDEVDAKQVISLNAGGVGYYRVQYSSSLFDSLLPCIPTMGAVDRLLIQNDLFALSRAGLAKTRDALKVTQMFKNEKDYTVWRNLNFNLTSILLLLQGTTAHQPFQQFLINLFKPTFEHIGWNPKEREEPTIAMLRGLLVSRLGKSGDMEVVKEARKRFEDHFNSSSSSKLNGDLKKAVYGVVLKHGGEEELQRMMELYKVADSQEERMRILTSMGSKQSPELIKKVLDFAIGPEVRYQDTIAGLVGATGGVVGRDMVWQFVKQHWESLFERFSGGFLLTRLIKYTTENFTTEEYAKDIKDFFSKHPVPIAERSIQQSLENISLNQRQLNRDFDDLLTFLSAQ